MTRTCSHSKTESKRKPPSPDATKICEGSSTERILLVNGAIIVFGLVALARLVYTIGLHNKGGTNSGLLRPLHGVQVHQNHIPAQNGYRHVILPAASSVS